MYANEWKFPIKINRVQLLYLCSIVYVHGMLTLTKFSQIFLRLEENRKEQKRALVYLPKTHPRAVYPESISVIELLTAVRTSQSSIRSLHSFQPFHTPMHFFSFARQSCVLLYWCCSECQLPVISHKNRI